MSGTEQDTPKTGTTEGTNPVNTDTKTPSDSAKADATNTQAKPTDQVKTGAPEKYDSFKFADGMSVSETHLKSFQTMAKEYNLTQEQAQKLVDFDVQRQTEFAQAQEQALEARANEWADKTRADKELGGERLTENLSVSKKALDKFGTPELVKLLDETGLGNHPDMIRVFYRIGKALGDEKVLEGKGNLGQSKNAAETMYPTMA